MKSQDFRTQLDISVQNSHQFYRCFRRNEHIVYFISTVVYSRTICKTAV